RMRDEAAVAGRSVTTVLPAQLLDGTQLGCGLGQTSGGGSVVEIHALLVQSLLSSLDGGLSGSFVDVFGASSSIGQNLHHIRLHFDEAAGDVEDFFLATLLDHPHRTRLEIAQQRRVARQDTDVTQVAMGDDHFHQPREQLFFRTDDVAMDCHSHTYASVICPRPERVRSGAGSAPASGRASYSFFAFSMASSMVPTM